MPIDNKIHLQVTSKKNPTTYQYGDLIYNKDGTLKTINEGSVPVELAKKADLTTEITTIENKLAKKADLDENGLVPASQLPSYVDDVLEFENKNNFPEIGEAHKVYVDITTNMTYRWSGSGYVIVGNDLALGETASTAYAGDKGKANADTIAAILDGTQIVGNANLLDGLDSTKYLTKIEYESFDKDEVVISEVEPTNNMAKIWYPIIEEKEEDYSNSSIATEGYVKEQLANQNEKTQGGTLEDLYNLTEEQQKDLELFIII